MSGYDDEQPETAEEMAQRHASEEHDARRSGASYAELAEMEARQAEERGDPPAEPVGVTAANSLRLGLLGWQPEHRDLYRRSANFAHVIDTLIGAAPHLVEAIAKSAREADAAAAAAARLMERGVFSRPDLNQP